MQRLINWEQKITKLGKVTMQISVENARSSSRHVSLQKMKRSVNFSNNCPLLPRNCTYKLVQFRLKARLLIPRAVHTKRWLERCRNWWLLELHIQVPKSREVTWSRCWRSGSKVCCGWASWFSEACGARWAPFHLRVFWTFYFSKCLCWWDSCFGFYRAPCTTTRCSIITRSCVLWRITR